jgi:hypothetical protein
MWQKIESAPRDGTCVLLAGREGICTGTWNERRRQWQVYTEDGWFEVEVYPTHWMPLPAPPADGER